MCGKNYFERFSTQPCHVCSYFIVFYIFPLRCDIIFLSRRHLTTKSDKIRKLAWVFEAGMFTPIACTIPDRFSVVVNLKRKRLKRCLTLTMTRTATVSCLCFEMSKKFKLARKCIRKRSRLFVSRIFEIVIC